MDRARQGVLFAFLAYASWGLLSPVGKHLYEHFDPMGLNAVRFTIATLVFLAFAGPAAIRGSIRLFADRRVLWVNVLANVSLTLFAYSLVGLPANFSTLGFYTAPVWTAILARMMLGEPLGKAFVPAVAGLLLGGYITLFGAVNPATALAASGASGGLDLWAFGLAVGSGVAWGFYTVYLRKSAPSLELKPLMGASFVFGATWYFALALATEPLPDILHQTPTTWGWIGIHVLFPSLIAFVLFNAALQRAGAGLVNILVGAELGFTVFFSWLLFQDVLAPDQLAGLAIVILSVTAYLWLHARTPSAKSQA